MSWFYGILTGSKGQATRCGTKNSGMTTICASYSGAIKCRAYLDVDGKDKVRIEFIPWEGSGNNKLIYEGDIDGKTFGMISDVVEKSGE